MAMMQILMILLMGMNVVLAAIHPFRSSFFKMQQSQYRLHYPNHLSTPNDPQSQEFINQFIDFLNKHWRKNEALSIKRQYDLERDQANYFIRKQMHRLSTLSEEWISATPMPFDAWIITKYSAEKYINDPKVRAALDQIELAARENILLEFLDTKYHIILYPLQEILQTSNHLQLIRTIIHDVKSAYDHPWNDESEESIESYTTFLSLNQQQDKIRDVFDKLQHLLSSSLLKEISIDEYPLEHNVVKELMRGMNHENAEDYISRLKDFRSLWLNVKSAFDNPILSLSFAAVQKLVSFMEKVSPGSKNLCQEYLLKFKTIKRDSLLNNIKELDPIVGSRLKSYSNIDEETIQLEKTLKVILSKQEAFDDPLNETSRTKVMEYLQYISQRYALDTLQIKNAFDKLVETRILSFISDHDTRVDQIIKSNEIQDFNALLDIYRIVLGKRNAFNDLELDESEHQIQDYCKLLTRFGLKEDADMVLEEFKDEKNLKCIICFQSMGNDIQKLPCQHQFHKKCIERCFCFVCQSQ